MRFSQRLNPRFLLAAALLLGFAVQQAARDNPPSLLRPDVRLRAYVENTGDGTVTVVDLIRPSVIATIAVGPDLTGIWAHPTRDEIWGVSRSEGFVWILDAETNHVVSQIGLEADLAALEFTKDGSTAFAVAPASRMVVSIDCGSRKVLKTTRIGKRPGTPKLTPDGKLLLIPDQEDASLHVLDASTLAVVSSLPVVRHPERVVTIPDSSKAFVTSSQLGQVAVVDLRKLSVETYLNLGVAAAGGPADAVLKPDGGELYLPHPAAHGLVILNTWTNEVSEFVAVGDAPTRAVITQDATRLFVADTFAEKITPIDVSSRRASNSIPVGKNPAATVFTPGEELLLVVNEGSNDLAVIQKRTLSLLTVIPVGLRPRDVAVLMF